METIVSECEGPAIKALGSHFKLTQVFVWSDGAQVSYLAERFKAAEVEDYSCLLHEDMELTRAMNALGLLLSFQTNEEMNWSIKGKRKVTKSKHSTNCRNLVDEALSGVSIDKAVSPVNFHDKTSSSLSFISMLGQSESSDYDVAVDFMSQCTSAEGDDSTTCPEIADTVPREKNDSVIHDSTINDAKDGGENLF